MSDAGNQQQQQQQTAWYDGLEAEVKGHVQRVGWDKLDAAAAAAAAAKSHREAELAYQKTLNIPRDELVRWPKDPNDPAMAEVWKRFGTPDTADAYKFEVEFADATVADLQAMSHEAKLNPTQAAIVARHLAQMSEKNEAAETQQQQAAAAAATAALDAQWGSNKEAATTFANRARDALGLPAEWTTPQFQPDGYARRMETLRALGAQMGEAPFLAGQGAATGGQMTYEQAVARRAELADDPAHRARRMAGDRAAQREFDTLDEIIVRHRMNGGPRF